MEQGTEGTQVPGNAAPTSAQAPAAPAAGAEMVEKKRLDGALQKIEELTLVNRTLTEQLNAIKGEKVALMAEYGQKETAWTAQQSEFTTKLTSAEAEKTQLATELAAAKALKLKMKIVQELNAPSLYNVLDVVPDSQDEAVLRPALQKLAQFAGTIAQTREQELLSGVTRTEKAPENNVQLPNSDEGWTNYINGLQFGSPEYQQAMDAWHKWLFKS